MTDSKETSSSNSHRLFRSSAAAVSGGAQPRYMRRRELIGVGVALLALGGGGAYALAQQASDAVEVIAVAHDVPRGQQIQEGDLIVTAVAPDTALSPVPADRLGDLIGQRAAADLTAGSLLSESAVAETVVPGAGQAVVGVAVTQAQMPTEPIVPGDRILVFDTPNAGDAAPASPPESIEAVVVSLSDGPVETGHSVLNVLVDRDLAGEVIALVATGHVGVALDSRETAPDKDSPDGE